MKCDLYHYFDKDRGPFRNLSALSLHAAQSVFSQIKAEGNSFASQRNDDYLTIRKGLEAEAREQFIGKGGNPGNAFPHYMTVGSCRWLETWYRNPGIVIIDWDEFVADSISFTYGDLFPTMGVDDGRPYRKQIYTKGEIIEIIRKYGFPQDWNGDGSKGPERYVEVQVWDEEIIKRYV